jgi:hypothetical protein
MVEPKTNTFGSFLEAYQSASKRETRVAGSEAGIQAQAEATVLNAIAQSGTISVVELIRETNLPATQVIGLVGNLADALLVSKKNVGGTESLELTDAAKSMGFVEGI